MKFFIAQFDKDYHCLTRKFIMQFKNKKLVQKWCRDNSWSGYDYLIIRN